MAVGLIQDGRVAGIDERVGFVRIGPEAGGIATQAFQPGVVGLVQPGAALTDGMFGGAVQPHVGPALCGGQISAALGFVVQAGGFFLDPLLYRILVGRQRGMGIEPFFRPEAVRVVLLLAILFAVVGVGRLDFGGVVFLLHLQGDPHQLLADLGQSLATAKGRGRHIGGTREPGRRPIFDRGGDDPLAAHQVVSLVVVGLVFVSPNILYQLPATDPPVDSRVLRTELLPAAL